MPITTTMQGTSNVTGRVLVVEDDAHSRELIQRRLVGLGHEVETSPDGKQAVDLLTEDFDVIVLDLNLPDTDGFALTKSIRETEALKDIPILICTAADDKPSRIEAVRVGANDFIGKPIDQLELQVRVEALTKLRHAQRVAKRRTQALEDSRAFLQATTAALPNAVAIVDRRGAIVAKNDSWRSLFGDEDIDAPVTQTALDSLGIVFWVIDESPKTGRLGLLELVQDVLTGKLEQAETLISLTRNSEVSWQLAQLTAYEVFDERFVALTLTDISNQKRMERELELRRRELETVAATDELTRVLNRRGAVSLLEENLGRFERYGRRFSVVLLDIDRFKSVNDTYGHDVGDRVLRNVAEILSHVSRETDHVARWGGEEFVVICAESGVDAGVRFAQRAQRVLASFSHAIGEEASDDPGFVVTASFGVTEVKKGDTLDSVVRRADEAMYTAKKQGRNQICVHSSES